MSTPLDPFAAAAARAVATALDLDDPGQFQVAAPPRPELGDYAVGCFPAAKALRAPPPKLAARVAERFSPGPELESAEAAGPFVNFRARRSALYGHLFSAAITDEPPLIPQVAGGEAICIDYSSPNISKQLAYHHIHGTAIGHALCNIFRALGYRAVGINHLGDWGTTHGMLLAAYERWGAPEPLTVEALNELYVEFRKRAEQDPALEDEARAWFARLEAGDEAARETWKRFRDVSWREFSRVYDELGIRFDEVKGESEYEDDIPEVLRVLEERGALAESEGALVVPVDDEGEDIPPLLLKKGDGATLYGTRDIAAAIYRHETYRFSQSLYVVDRGQALHFKQLFAALRKAGFSWADRMVHVAFGLVRIGGKKTGTRTGSGVKLLEVLTEATARSRERVQAANPNVSAEEVDRVAHQVGVGAVVFANLISQRQKDVDFDWDEILTWDGDSGPYIQYAHARCSSILRRAREQGLTPTQDAERDRLAGDREWALARKLAEFPDVVRRSAQGYEPHHLARYLLDVCAAFSTWYTAGAQDASQRVLASDRATAEARLTLVATTREVLQRGLGLLGVAAPDAM